MNCVVLFVAHATNYYKSPTNDLIQYPRVHHLKKVFSCDLLTVFLIDSNCQLNLQGCITLISKDIKPVCLLYLSMVHNMINVISET